METQYISLNMTPSGVNPIFHISQYDVGRVLGFYVYNGSEVVDLDDYTCTIEATRTDGTQITTNVITDNNSGIFAVTATMSNVADKYNCQLVIVDGNTNRVASLPFVMDVVTAALNGNDSSIYDDRTLYQQYNASMQAALANEVNARTNKDTLLQAQIDQLIAPSGEAPSAAEVQNARIGADGITYPTLGDAIRTNDNKILGAIKALDCEVVAIMNYSSAGTAAILWKTSDNPTITDNMYICLYDCYGIANDVETPLYVNLRYSDNSTIETAVPPNVITKIKTKSLEGETTRLVFRRSNSNLSESVSSTWSFVIFKGTPNKLVLEHVNDILITQKEFNGIFIRGGINASTKEWVNSTQGVVQYRNYPLRLNVNDKIYLSDYTNVHFRVMYITDGTSTKTVSNWVSSGEYTVSNSGIYWIEVATNPSSDVTNIETYVNLIRVLKNGDIYDAINDSLVSAKRTDWFVKSINHRGFNLIAPENTMPAFVLSAKLGFKYIETDISYTSDNVIVLIHDSTINRTARNNDGTEISDTVNIHDITYEQALNYDYGIWKGTQYARTKIPTLDEFLKFCRKASIHPYLDFGSIDDTTIINNVVALVKRNGMENNATIVANSTYTLEIVADHSSKIRLGLIASPSDSSIGNITTLKNSYNNEFFIDAQTGTYSTDEIINSLINANIPLETYTPNYIDTLDILDAYVTGITSDNLLSGKLMYEKAIGIN